MKKVLSLVLAAAMALGVTATAFAAQTMEKTSLADKKDTGIEARPEGLGITVTEYGRADMDENGNIPYGGKSGKVIYRVKATANQYAYGKEEKGDIILNVHSFALSASVKGPADITQPDPDMKSFKWNYTANNTLTVEFLFTVEITPNDAASVAPKGIVLTANAKPSPLCPPGSGVSANWRSSCTLKDITVGYYNDDIDDLYDTVYAAWEDMNNYGEDNFEVIMNNNPVIPASVVKFLAKNLGKKTATFVLNSVDNRDIMDPTYFDGVYTVTLNKKAFNDLPANKHINIRIQGTADSKIDAVLEEAGIEHKWFTFAAQRPGVVGTFSAQTLFDEAYVYVVDEEGILNPEPVATLSTEDYQYGDVVFTGPMTQYVITEGPIPEDLWEDDEPTDEPIEDDDNGLVDEDGNQIENNPGTGSSNAISLAVAMAVVSLAAAGLVVTKKASK